MRAPGRHAARTRQLARRGRRPGRQSRHPQHRRLLPRCTLLGPNLTRLPAAAAARGEVVISIDDGPDPEVTPGCSTSSTPPTPGPFFCIGQRAAAHPGLVRDIINRATVENHSEHHWKRFSTLGPSAMVRKWRRPRPASRP
jgi:peptidoglycan/xylan/chitin deacetylase (PgdA/CDA1 family)